MDRFFPSNQQSDPWFRVGTVDVTTTILIVGIGVCSMFAWAIDPRSLDPHKLLAEDVRAGQIWRVFTWPLVNEPSIWTVLSLAIFFLFGREIERTLGRVRFLWFLLVLTVIPGIVGTLLDLNAWGLQLINTGIFLVFVMMYPTARSWFDIPLWVFGAVFLGITVLQLVGFREWDMLLFLLVTCATALLAARSFDLLPEIHWLPKIPIPGGSGGGGRQRKPKAPRRRGGRQRGPADVIPIRPNQPTAADLLRQAEVDVLLDKISEHGLSSLTPEERRRLDEHSRRLREER
jgi:membrane associated rhomboid family serine protease